MSTHRSTNAGRRLVPLLLPLALLAAACGQKSGVAGTDDAATAAHPAAPVDASRRRPRQLGGDRGARHRRPARLDGDPVRPPRAAPARPRRAGRPPRRRRPSGRSSPATTTPPASPTPRSSSASTPRSPAPRRSRRRASTSARTSTGSSSPSSAPDQLFGRKVRVVFRDDEFNPQHAVQVCREMVEQDGAFLLVGGGGADQITACAQYADENGIPYLSAGVNEDGLADLDDLLRLDAHLRRAGADADRPDRGRGVHRDRPRRRRHPVVRRRAGGDQGRGRGGRRRRSSTRPASTRRRPRPSSSPSSRS